MNYKSILISFFRMWKLIFVFVLFPMNSYSQNMPSPSIKIPIEMKPSPEAASLGKYGDIPVSYYTGTPDISIPLFDVTDSDFSFPIKLSYHASGIKVNDIASWAGLGWSLITGGVINRKIRHHPDNDYYEKIPTRDEVVNQKNYYFLHMQANGPLGDQKDLQPDEFTYSFMNYSGKFVWDTNKKAYLNPYNDLIIQYDAPSFRVKTPDGYHFIFKDVDYSFFNSPAQDGYGSMINYSATVSWFLSAVVSPAQDTICRFKYERQEKEMATTDIQYYSTFGEMQTCSQSDRIPMSNTTRIEQTNLTYQCYLKEITYSQGKIIFEASEGRLDKNKGGLILNAIKVYASGELKRWIELKHDYFYSDKGFNLSNIEENKYRLKLESLVEKDINGIEIKKYRFEYNPELLPPYGNFGVDIWGGYNGKEDNETLSYWKNCQPISHDYKIALTTGDRDPDEEKMQACMLSRIYYPTQGYTDFEFESNRHPGTINKVPHIMGGLRIRGIKNYDNDGKLLLFKEYRYGKDEDGFGQLISQNYDHTAYEKEIKGCEGPHFCMYSSHSIGPLLFLSSHPIDVPSLEPNEVIFYPYVSEYIWDNEHLKGKTSFIFDFSADNFISQNAEIITNYRFSSNAWKRGNLLQQDIYEGESENNLRLIYRKENVYKDYEISKTRGLSISGKWLQPSSKDMENIQYYSIYDKYEVSAIRKVIQSKESLYTNEGTITKKKEYKYDMLGGIKSFTQPTEIIEYVNADTIRTVLIYPFNLTERVYNQMNNDYILPVIEERVYKNNVFLSSIKTNYMKWLNHYVPSSIETKQGTAAPETRIQFVNYNRGGKPVYIIKDEYLKVVYLWGYHNQFPVAEIKNATYDDVLKIIPADKQEYIADNFYSLNQMSYYLNLLYDGLPSAQIKLSTFNPLWGVNSMTNSQKINLFYDYDSFGRLQKSYYRINGANQVLKSYDYHYKP